MGDSRKLYYLDAQRGRSVPLRKSMVGAFSSEAGTTDGLCRVVCPWGKGIVGLVASDGHAIVTNKASAHPAYDAEIDSGLDENGNEIPCTSLLATPVRAGDGSVGAVVELLDKKVGSFGPTDVKLLRQVAPRPSHPDSRPSPRPSPHLSTLPHPMPKPSPRATQRPSPRPGPRPSQCPSQHPNQHPG